MGFLEQAIAMQRDDDGLRYWTYRLLASAYALTGRIEEAKHALAESDRLQPYDTVRSHSGFMALSETYASQIRHVQDGLRLAGERDHADEDADFGVPTDRILHSSQTGPTPKDTPGVMVIRTPDLARLVAEARPVIVDTMAWGRSLPGAVGLRNAGVGGSFDDAGQDHLRSKMNSLTGGDSPGRSLRWASILNVSAGATFRFGSPHSVIPRSTGIAADARHGKWPPCLKHRSMCRSGSPALCTRPSTYVRLPGLARAALLVPRLHHRLANDLAVLGLHHCRAEHLAALGIRARLGEGK